MAKRKLSPEHRSTLREDLRKGRKDGTKVADLLREIAKKYGISTITARWYLSSLDGRKTTKKAAKRGGSKRRPGLPPGSKNGDGFGLVELVKARARNARKVGRLIPRWQKLVSREEDLKQLAAKVGRQLSATRKKAGALRKRIDELVAT